MLSMDTIFRCLLAGAALTVLLLSACGGGDGVLDSYDKTREAPAVLSGCSAEDAQATLDAIEIPVEDFADSFERAEASSRIALSPAISDMQAARRAIQRAEIPECGARVVALFASAWSTAIDGFLAFQSQEPDSIVTAKFNTAATTIGQAHDAVADLRVDALGD